MSDKLTKAVEALRKKEADKLIKWEAEMIIILEKYTNERIINELTDDIDIYEYIATLIPNISYKLSESINLCLNHYKDYNYSYGDIIKKWNSSESQSEQVIRLKCIVNYITTIKNSPVYLEKEKLRKEESTLNYDEEKERAEKKRKEIEEIQKQIAELQVKLVSLQK